MSIVIKNTTGVEKNWGGKSYQASSSYTIEAIDRLRLLSDSIFLSDLSSGNAVVNDGTSDLNFNIGLSLLKNESSTYHSFLSTLSTPSKSNGFVATDTQAAIEESKTNAESRSRFAVNAGFDGNASSGRYLEFNSNVASNQSGFVLPRNAKLKEISLVVSTNSTTNFQIINWNGTTETLITNISLSASRKSTVTNLSISLNANEELRVKCSSGSCSRPIVYLFLLFD